MGIVGEDRKFRVLTAAEVTDYLQARTPSPCCLLPSLLAGLALACLGLTRLAALRWRGVCLHTLPLPTSLA